MYETIQQSHQLRRSGIEKSRIIFAPTTFGLAEDEYFEKIPQDRRRRRAMINHR